MYNKIILMKVRTLLNFKYNSFVKVLHSMTFLSTKRVSYEKIVFESKSQFIILPIFQLQTNN